MRDRCSSGRSDQRCGDDWRRGGGNGKIPTGGWTDDNDYDDALNRVQVKMQSVSLSSK